MEPHGPGERPGERLLLQRLLSFYREPSTAGDQLQLFTQQFVLRTLSRSLSVTLPWEVDKLSGSLQPQQAAINMGLGAGGPGGLGAPPARPAGLLGASWHDIQLVRLEACLEARDQELAATMDTLPEDAKLAALIELKKLKLAGLQRELRQEILLEQRLVEACSSPTVLLDWTRWCRPPASRLNSFVPPRLPAVEVQRRLLRDPETARRARQHAVQHWAAQQQQQQQAVQAAAAAPPPQQQSPWQPALAVGGQQAQAQAQRWESLGLHPSQLQALEAHLQQLQGLRRQTTAAAMPALRASTPDMQQQQQEQQQQQQQDDSGAPASKRARSGGSRQSPEAGVAEQEGGGGGLTSTRDAMPEVVDGLDGPSGAAAAGPQPMRGPSRDQMPVADADMGAGPAGTSQPQWADLLEQQQKAAVQWRGVPRPSPEDGGGTQASAEAASEQQRQQQQPGARKRSREPEGAGGSGQEGAGEEPQSTAPADEATAVREVAEQQGPQAPGPEEPAPGLAGAVEHGEGLGVDVAVHHVAVAELPEGVEQGLFALGEEVSGGAEVDRCPSR